MIKVRPDPDACDPNKLYEYIAHQIEREDNLYQTRLTTCVVVNLGLGAAAASQVTGQIDARIYVIVIVCCAIGGLITEGIRRATNAGKVQNQYLWDCFGDIEGAYPERYPYPFYHTEEKQPSLVPAKLTAITIVFEVIWAVIFLLVTSIFLYSLYRG